MPVLFTSSPGSTVAVRVSRAAFSYFSIGAASKPFSANAVTTSLTLRQEVGVQFKKSLRRSFYAYPFGDEPSQIQINFALFTKDCDGQPTKSIEALLAYYRSIKFNPETFRVSNIVIADQEMYGICKGMELRLNQSGGQMITTASMDFVSWMPFIPDEGDVAPVGDFGGSDVFSDIGQAIA